MFLEYRKLRERHHVEDKPTPEVKPAISRTRRGPRTGGAAIPAV
jgi:hypothetical protein